MFVKIAVFLALLCVAFARTHFETKLQFNQFMRTHNKQYSSMEEKQKRFEIFQNNLIKADRLTAQSSSAKYGVTKFADMTEAEFRQFFLIENFKSFNKDANNEKKLAQYSTAGSLPAQFDWRDRNAVTPVKNQEQCGSCWAFSATEAIESAWFLAGNTLVSLSPQQIVDCDVGHGDEGCNGGDTTTAYEYVIRAGGMETEDSYPYVGEDESCTFQDKKIVASIKDWHYITQDKNETGMQYALTELGPLSICVDATSWQFYISGVVTSPEICGDELDHCVMITGYQNYEEIWGTYPVWNIRNSWGADWGMDGYILVERGYDLCGVADEVTLPIID